MKVTQTNKLQHSPIFGRVIVSDSQTKELIEKSFNTPEKKASYEAIINSQKPNRDIDIYISSYTQKIKKKSLTALQARVGKTLFMQDLNKGDNLNFLRAAITYAQRCMARYKNI